MEYAITTLRSVIQRQSSGSDAGFVWTCYPLCLDARCVVSDDDGLDERMRRKHGLTARLPLADVLAIVGHTRRETPCATLDEVLAAVDWLYFFSNCS